MSEASDNRMKCIRCGARWQIKICPACASFPDAAVSEATKMLRRLEDMDGLGLLYALCFVSTGWRFEPELTPAMGYLERLEGLRLVEHTIQPGGTAKLWRLTVLGSEVATEQLRGKQGGL